MRKHTWIVLFICGLTTVSNAQIGSEMRTASQNTEARTLENNLVASAVNIKTTTSNDFALAQKPKKGWKKFKDRTLAGKILVCAGVGAFALLCLMYGTVSVG